MAALLRLALRRDRLRLPAYALGVAGLWGAMLAMEAASPYAALADETRIFATTPAVRIFGLASGVGAGANMAIRGGFVVSILAALISALTVVRHTRQSEESGRSELLGARRHASLAVALLVATGANVALAAALTAAGVAAGQPLPGALTAGAAIGALGTVFAGVAAVTAQLASTARGASGLAAAAFGAAFLVTGAGNVLGSADPTGTRVTAAWPAWLTPLGWSQNTRPFGGDDWRPLLLSVATFAVLTAAAFALEARRDAGAGVLPVRRGPARGSVAGPFGLAWRLQRGALLAWGLASAGFGLVFGAIAGQVTDGSAASARWYERMGGSTEIAGAYRAAMVQMAGMAVAVYAVQVLLRMRDERLELVLSAAVSRARWVGAQLASAGLGAVAILVAFGACMGLTGGGPLELVGASLVQLAGVLALGAVVPLAFALVPRRAAAVAWAALLAAILLGPMFGGATFRLPERLQDLSPFTHVPKAPAVAVSAAPVAALLVAAALVTLTGVAVLRRRDLAGEI
ncbi:MAG TPA: ABC transporter permease [Solirubrobacter sp.]|nr:ABC transporter permease [Solirubrobacter sp.]